MTNQDQHIQPQRIAPAPRRVDRIAPVLLMLLALAHGLIYAFGIPLWQTPDEPMLYEYAALTAELGRVPQVDDRSPALEQALVGSLARNDFYRHGWDLQPDPPPTTLDEAQGYAYMPRQVGGDPPLYFTIAALVLHGAGPLEIDAQVYLLRVLNVLLLPFVVFCTYQAGRILAGADPRLAWLPIAAGALVALQPMATYVGASLSNDGPANAIGAMLCLLLVRGVTGGLRWRDLLLIGAVTLIGLLVKRTLLPYLLLLGPLLVIAILRGLRPVGAHDVRRRVVLLSLSLGVTLLGGVWVWSQFDQRVAARWIDAQSLTAAPREATPGGPALRLRAGDEVVQGLPAVSLIRLRGNAVRYGVSAWSDTPATGRLIIHTDDRRDDYPFQVNGGLVEMSGWVPNYTQSVRVGIVADSGWFYADEFWMHGVGVPGQLIANAHLERAALREGSLLQAFSRYLRFDDVLWSLGSGRLAWGLPLDLWARLLFISFWGHFGWFNIAVVHEGPWEPAIAVFVGLGLAGMVPALLRAAPAQRRVLIALLALLIMALVPLLFNALIDPNGVQQGRYLFPILPALALIVAYGQCALVPLRAQTAWFLGWLGFWALFAAYTLVQLAGAYG